MSQTMIDLRKPKRRNESMAVRKPKKVFPTIADGQKKAPRQKMSSILGSVRVVSCRG